MKRLIYIFFLIFAVVSLFGSEVYLMDEELPPERFQMVGDQLYIYSVNLMQKLNTEFKWDNINKTLDVEWNGNFIQFNNNSTKVSLNGKTLFLTTPPRIINNRFFLPLLDTCRLLGLRIVSENNKYFIYSSISEFNSYFWTPNGLILNFSEPVTLSISQYSNETAVFDIIGARTNKLQEDSNLFLGINEFKVENLSEDTMKSFLRLSFSYNDGVYLEPFVIGSSVYFMTPDSQKMTYTVENRKEDNIKRIVIDPGHGGFDPGAIADSNGYQEKDGVLLISKFLKNKLEEKGYKVLLTRSSDNYVEFMERARIANDFNADIFVSIHLNSVDIGSVDGVELFYYQWSESGYKARLDRFYKSPELTASQIETKVFNKIDQTLEGENLAEKIASAFTSEGFTFRKSVPEDFAVLAYSEMPSVLVECGYLSNPTFAKNIKQAYFQESIAEAIANGIEKYIESK
ncbi:MAG TPA: N-acetylmuramoyl-L-alanine amidase [Thermotogota bacterium]|nr:N-acetylmuramoyl-L-alanine amidase [Thermotogota bacterium]HPJ87640.1 N-acetylmuramoyl-L-alanine amidase [Thermotogota bacterium]HPR94922.1 N-acetylmuramoyl-L-alanine amidase [Thermotogota bacterium]